MLLIPKANYHMTSLLFAFLVEKMSTLKAKKKTLLKGHMINRILHSWSFHMKIIKLARGLFDKFHMK